MKTLIIYLLASLPMMASAQKIEKDASGKLMSMGVIPIDSTSKDQLFSRSMEWVALNYKSAKDVIQHSSKEDGKIICKGNFPVSLYMKSGWVEHTLMLEFKDNRFKYTYSNFVYNSSGSGSVPFDGAMMGKKKAISTTEEKIQNSVKALTEYLKSNNSATSDKW